MDSVTQIALGATVAAICVPKEHRRKAALMGAALGTLPDLDVYIDYGSAVSNFTLHRGFSHSLIVLAAFSVLLWLLLKRFSQVVKEMPIAWFWAIFLPLFTHPLLDAHTAYGTQLLWPFEFTPTMWSTIFIIDPLYTLPLLIALITVLIAPRSIAAKKSLVISLTLSTIYLGWSWIAKSLVHQQIYRSPEVNNSKAKIFTTPTPFNTLMWRIVVLDGHEYLEGYYHFLYPDRIHFNRHLINQPLFDEGNAIASVHQLQWFADGFNRADVIDGYLVISDLRMGFEDNYAFRHQVARRDNDTWLPITSGRLPRELDINDLDDFWKAFKKPIQ